MKNEGETGDVRTHAHPGLFLVLDGPDGGGKTTQAARLAAWLRGRGLEVVTCRDPGGTALGDRAREILLARDTVPISLRAEMLLYMASRAELVEEVISPALAAGHVVVSDRYLLANIVYQGSAGGLMEEEIALVGMVATSGLLPDLTLILDIAPDAAAARVGRPRDRIEDRPLFYHERVRAGYLAAARGETRPAADGDGGTHCPFYPAPIVLIDASNDPETVFEQLKCEVERVLAPPSTSPLPFLSGGRPAFLGLRRRSGRRNPEEQLAARAAPARLVVRRPWGNRQAQLRPQAGASALVRDTRRVRARPLRDLSGLLADGSGHASGLH